MGALYDRRLAMSRTAAMNFQAELQSQDHADHGANKSSPVWMLSWDSRRDVCTGVCTNVCGHDRSCETFRRRFTRRAGGCHIYLIRHRMHFNMLPQTTASTPHPEPGAETHRVNAPICLCVTRLHFTLHETQIVTVRGINRWFLYGHVSLRMRANQGEMSQ